MYYLHLVTYLVQVKGRTDGQDEMFFISNFRRVLKVLCFLLGI